MLGMNHFRRYFALGVLGLFLWPSLSWAAVYKVDPDHTTVSFKVRHLFSKVQGLFNKFEGTIDYEPGKPETWKTSGTIDATSINTNVPERDKHLRSADFFDVEKYPTISYKSTKVTNATETSAKLEGFITIHGVEKPITLDLEIRGAGKDPWGNTRAGFTATTKINRKDFGLNWNQALETGGVLVGDEVEITLEIEGILNK
jgi:polyisoprenoid-binding protein YceI